MITRLKLHNSWTRTDKAFIGDSTLIQILTPAICRLPKINAQLTAFNFPMVSVWSSMILHLIRSVSPSCSFVFRRDSFSLHKLSICASSFPRSWARQDPGKQTPRSKLRRWRVCLLWTPNSTTCNRWVQRKAGDRNEICKSTRHEEERARNKRHISPVLCETLGHNRMRGDRRSYLTVRIMHTHGQNTRDIPWRMTGEPRSVKASTTERMWCPTQPPPLGRFRVEWTEVG